VKPSIPDKTMQDPAKAAGPATTPVTRVLVIEDDEAFRVSVKRALELAGYEVSLFEDAESAMEQMAAVAPAAVLTDLRLPKADGLFVLQRAREKDADLPVVLMTGHGDIPNGCWRSCSARLTSTGWCRRTGS
jgi:FixJ family two-component response regulator